MNVSESLFGELPNEKRAKLFTIDTCNGMIIKITNYGGIITSISTANRYGKMDEITAGFPNLQQYLRGHPHFGAIVGRFANRIAYGRFSLHGRNYTLPLNNGPNHLHGGNHGFHTKLWDYSILSHPAKVELMLTYLSQHMEEGYPGNVKATVTYTIFSNNEVQIEFRAITDTPTHINLTSHCYFNLNGFETSVHNHSLRLNSQFFLPTDLHQIPTGEKSLTAGTPFHLGEERALSDILSGLPHGLDHCYWLNENRGHCEPAAVLSCTASGRRLEVYCTQPGVQVYTGNFLDGTLQGHDGTRYEKQWAICIETQHFPDTPNQPTFPTTLLSPGEEYSQATRLAFSTF